MMGEVAVEMRERKGKIKMELGEKGGSCREEVVTGGNEMELGKKGGCSLGEVVISGKEMELGGKRGCLVEMIIGGCEGREE